MSDPNEEDLEAVAADADDGPDNFLIDILTGNKESVSPKKLLVLRRRSQEELIHTEHPEHEVFMAVVDRAGVDARGNLFFH